MPKKSSAVQPPTQPTEAIFHEDWPVTSLTDHPRQHDIFGEPTELEIEELATDIERHGLQQTIEILADGTLVKGHKRVRAIRRLGWETIAVVIRHDLRDRPDQAECELISDNLMRRQLSGMALARSYQALRDVQARMPRDLAEDAQPLDLRDSLGKKLGMSGRNLDRYLLVLNTPMEVQEAVDARRLKLVDAGRVAALPARAQKKIAKAIRDGANPQTIVDAQLAKRPKRPADAGSTYLRGMRTLDEAVKAINPYVNDAPAAVIEETHLASLDAAVACLRALQQQVRRQLRKRAKSVI